MDKKVKPTTLRPPRENIALEKDYAKRLIKLTTDIGKSFLYWTLATVNKNANKNISKQLVFNFNELLKEWNKKTSDFAKKEATKTTKQVSSFVNGNLKNQSPEFALKRSSKEIDNSLNAVYERNYNLIKTIPQDIKERFESVFLNNVNNFDQEAILKQVETIDGISKRRAKTIARDQVAKAIGEYHATREQALGFEYYMWQTSKDERVSTGKGGHRQLEGRIYRYDTPTAIIDAYSSLGHPAQRVNCLASGQGIDLNNRVSRLFRASVCDKFTFVSFENWTLIVTRDHKMLTPNGWIKAQFLKEGDNIIDIGNKTDIIDKINLYKNKVIVSQIFNFVDKSFGSSLSNHLGLSRLGVAGNFDADIREDEQIDIIDINCFLENGIKFIISQCCKHFNFSNPLMRIEFGAYVGGILSTDCTSDFNIFSSFDSLNSFDSFFSDDSSLFNSGIFKSDDVGFTARTNFVSNLFKSIDNHWTRDIEFFTHFKNTISSDVALFKVFYIYFFFISWRSFSSNELMFGDMPVDSGISDTKILSDILNTCSAEIQVVKSVNTKFFNSHIYSLESDLGYYTINGLINKNCRCRRKAVILKPNQEAKLVKDSLYGDYYIIVEK